MTQQTAEVEIPKEKAALVLKLIDRANKLADEVALLQSIIKAGSDGRRVEVVVQRINGKSVSCVEVANIRSKWRVSPECLNMDGVSKVPEKRYTASPKPSQDYGQTAW